MLWTAENGSTATVSRFDSNGQKRCQTIGYSLSWFSIEGDVMRLPLVIAFVAALVGSSFPLQARDTVSTAPESLTDDEAMQLLAEPMRLVSSDKIADARSKFEMLLKDVQQHHGESVQVADLMSSFGIFLIGTSFAPGREAQRPLGQAYLHRAVSAYRTALGGSNPAVAEALLIEAAGEPSATARETLLKEALQVQLGSLGQKHPDTRKTLLLLAVLRGDPDRTRRDPVQVEAAANAFRELIDISPDVMARGKMQDSAGAVRFELAAMYARNGMIDRAVTEAIEARKQVLKWPDVYRCGTIEIEMGTLARALIEGGQAHVKDVARGIVKKSPSDCAIDTIIVDN